MVSPNFFCVCVLLPANLREYEYRRQSQSPPISGKAVAYTAIFLCFLK